MLRNLSLDGELFLPDGKNAAFYKFAISCRYRQVWKMLRYTRAVSDWLNLHSLGTMSAFGYIENLDLNLSSFK